MNKAMTPSSQMTSSMTGSLTMTRVFRGCRLWHHHPSKPCDQDVVALPYGSHMRVCQILTFS